MTTPEERETKLAAWRVREAQAQQKIADQVEEMIPHLVKRIKKNATIRDEAIYSAPTDELIKKISNMDILPEGRPDAEVYDVLLHDIMESGMSIQHPRFLSYVTSTVSPYSLATAILTDVYNPNAAAFYMAPAINVAEEKVVRWMADCAGFPETAGGVFVSGGSMANFTGQIAARDNMLEEQDWARGVAYFSDQTHSSTEKGLHMIGLRRDQIVKIPTDDAFKIRVDVLREHITADIAAGKRPFLIVGNLGTTNTGSIDPLNELADLANEFNMWLHVDGAFGGSLLASKKYRVLASGIERANSLAWDSHKWLMQTYSCSTTLFRDKNQALKSFANHPEYLATLITDEHDESCDMGPEMSRPARGLKLWTTLQALGSDEVSTLIGKAWHMTKAAVEEFDARIGWQILAEPCCGTVAFRYVPQGWADNDKINELNHRISVRTINEGFTYIAETTLKGNVAMRLNMINVRTTDEDVREVVAYLQTCAEKEVELAD